MSYQVCRVSTAWSPLGTVTVDFVVSRLSRSLPTSEYHSRAPSSPLSSITCLRFGRGMMTPVEPAAPIAAGWSFTVAVVLRLTTLGCLLYTSDAADDLLCVDFGGRRFTK